MKIKAEDGRFTQCTKHTAWCETQSSDLAPAAVETAGLDSGLTTDEQVWPVRGKKVDYMFTLCGPVRCPQHVWSERALQEGLECRETSVTLMVESCTERRSAKEDALPDLPLVIRDSQRVFHGSSTRMETRMGL